MATKTVSVWVALGSAFTKIPAWLALGLVLCSVGSCGVRGKSGADVGDADVDDGELDAVPDVSRDDLSDADLEEEDAPDIFGDSDACLGCDLKPDSDAMADVEILTYGDSLDGRSSGDGSDIGDVSEVLGDEDSEAVECDGCGQGSVCVEGKCTSTPKCAWAASVGGTAGEVAPAMGMLPDGGVVVGGHSTSAEIMVADEKVNLPGPLGDMPKTDGFVVAYAPDGTVTWTHVFGGDGDERVRALATDPAGNTVVSGYTTSDLLVSGDAELPGAFGKMDIFLIALDVSGKQKWAKRLGGADHDAVFGMTAGPDGDVVFGGYFVSPEIYLGGDFLTNVGPGTYDVFIARFDKDGNHIWSRSADGATFSYVHSAAIDSEDNVVACGGFKGGVLKSGPMQLPNAGEEDTWVARFGPGGEPLYWASYGGPNHDACHSVASTPDGGVVVVGSFQSPFIDFGGDKIPHVGAPGTHDLYVFKLASDGQHVWSQGHGGGDWDLAKTVAIDGAGRIFVGGATNSPSIDVGGGPLTGAGPSGAFAQVLLFQLSSGGQHVWSASFGGPDEDVGYAVGATPAGRFAAVGSYNDKDEGIPAGTISPCNGNPLPAYGGKDAFVVVFD